MTQIYYAILTAVGEAKLANATALGTQLQVSRMAVGDGGGALPTPNRSQSALVGEQYRADLNTLQVDPANASQIIAELVIPETEGGWWLREMGLYDAAGDLIAVSNCPPSYKPQMAEGSGRTQVLRMVLIVSSTAAVQLKIDPSVVLATRAYADSLITVHQAAADPHTQYQLRGAVTTLAATATISAAQIGLLLLDASGGSRTFTLPQASEGLGVRELVVRRVDVTTNALVIAANGADKLMLDTTAQATGQASTELLFAGDFLRLRSDGAGKWWCVGQAQLPGSIATGMVVLSATGSYSVPPVLRSGRRRANVKVTGAGGGAGRFMNGGGGGGGGGRAAGLVDLTAVTSVAVTIGQGGAGLTVGQGDGAAGGTSSFGAYMSATGGFGGSKWFGGQGGVGVGGQVNGSLGNGAHTSRHDNGSSPASVYGGGHGGGPGGVGSGSGVTGSAGNSASIPGGGGGAGNEYGNGGNGAPGQVTIGW